MAVASAPLLSTVELAQFLGVPVRTLYRWRAYGTGPRAIRVGRHTRYRTEDVQLWLSEREDTERGASP